MKPIRLRRVLAVAAVALSAFGGTRARALINASFTPVEMAKQSTLIVSIEVGPLDDKNNLPVHVLKTLKGQLTGDTVTIDLSQVSADGISQIKDTLGGKKQLALLFASDQFKGLGDTATGKGEEGFLHMGHSFGHMWYSVSQGDAGRWSVTEGDESRMQAVWAGGTDMLTRATEWALADSRASIPAAEGITWGTNATKDALMLLDLDTPDAQPSVWMDTSWLGAVCGPMLLMDSRVYAPMAGWGIVCMGGAK